MEKNLVHRVGRVWVVGDARVWGGAAAETQLLRGAVAVRRVADVAPFEAAFRKTVLTPDGATRQRERERESNGDTETRRARD